ncbi:MAG: STAS domain-containing protein [Muribaculaceae bacterium]
METNISEKEGFKILSIKGRLDTIASTDFETTLQQFIAVPNLKLKIDMTELTYISSSGLRCFVMLLKDMKVHNGTLILSGLTHEINEIFDMTGFSDLFNIEKNQ